MIRGLIRSSAGRAQLQYGGLAGTKFTGKFQKKYFSISKSTESDKPAALQYSKLTIEKTTKPRLMVAPEQLTFGRHFSDHMLEADWSLEKGWTAPKISAYHNLSLEPSASVFHYALECFEGMKAYKDAQGRARLFRPDKNWERFTNSAKRLVLPTMPYDDFLRCLKELVRLDSDWIPSQRGYSLYIRPAIIGTQTTLGVAPSATAKFFVICSPVGPYYPEGWKPVKLYADSHYVRAWPGGTGAAKVGSNYALGIKPQQEAANKGFSQILWLFGPEHHITEVGSMNLFVYWINAKGQKELITAPLDGTVLPGVTRDSVIALSQQWGEFAVSESFFTIHDLTKALKEDRVLEVFGCGTAAVVSPVKVIHYDGIDYKIPIDKNDANASIGPLAKRFADTLMDIQYGDIKHDWSIIID